MEVCGLLLFWRTLQRWVFGRAYTDQLPDRKYWKMSFCVSFYLGSLSIVSSDVIALLSIPSAVLPTYL